MCISTHLWKLQQFRAWVSRCRYNNLRVLYPCPRVLVVDMSGWIYSTDSVLERSIHFHCLETHQPAPHQSPNLFPGLSHPSSARSVRASRSPEHPWAAVSARRSGVPEPPKILHRRIVYVRGLVYGSIRCAFNDVSVSMVFGASPYSEGRSFLRFERRRLLRTNLGVHVHDRS